MNPKLQATYDAVVNGDLDAAKKGVQAAIDAAIPAGEILQEGLIAPMNKVGELFEKQEYFVPEMLVAARAMQGGLALLKPKLVASGVKPIGTVVMGTVKGDLHDIGKNLVTMMLEGAGFSVVDIGVDQSPEKFVEAAKANRAQVVGISALLTTTMPNMKLTIEALKSTGVREKAKVIIGGAPVTQAYADQIGADGYAPDASRAVALAKSLMGV